MSTGLLDPAGAFVGAVLHSTADGARSALALVDPDDLGDHRLTLVATVCAELAAEDVAPHPVAVLARARRDAVVSGADATAALAALLAEVYGWCPVPASVRYYAGAVLTEALRRRVAAAGARLGQAAQSESLSSLLALVNTEAEVIAELRDRLVTAGAITA